MSSQSPFPASQQGSDAREQDNILFYLPFMVTDGCKKGEKTVLHPQTNHPTYCLIS
jgi:hypothetical protein